MELRFKEIILLLGRCYVVINLVLIIMKDKYVGDNYCVFRFRNIFYGRKGMTSDY